jgi:hypothetical protein
MVHNTQNYWVFGLCPSSDILKNNEEHNIRKTGSVSFLRWRDWRKPTLLGPLEKANLVQWLRFIIEGYCSLCSILPSFKVSEKKPSTSRYFRFILWYLLLYFMNKNTFLIQLWTENLSYKLISTCNIEIRGKTGFALQNYLIRTHFLGYSKIRIKLPNFITNIFCGEQLKPTVEHLSNFVAN